MTNYAPVIEELQKSLKKMTLLQQSVLNRSVRVEKVPVNGSRVDVTDELADALRDGANALTRAIEALQNIA